MSDIIIPGIPASALPLASSQGPGAMTAAEHAAASVGLPTIMTFQFSAAAAYTNNQTWIEPNGKSTRRSTYQTQAGTQYGATVFDIRNCTTAQDVAVVAAGIINGDANSLFTANTPVGGLLTLTAKALGPQNNITISGTGPGTCTITQYGRAATNTLTDPAPVSPLLAGTVWAAFGDSITIGLGLSAGQDYVSVAAAKLGIPVMNYGVSGESCQTIVGEPNPLNPLTAQIGDIVNHPNVNLITLMIGVNDFASARSVLGAADLALAKALNALDHTSSFAEAFCWVLRTVNAAVPTARIGVILPVNTSAAAGTANTLQAYRNVQERIALALSTQMNVEVLKPAYDLGMRSTDEIYFQVDHVHPNATGQAVLGGYVARKLTQAASRESAGGQVERWEKIAEVAPTTNSTTVDFAVTVANWKRLQIRYVGIGVSGGAGSMYLRVDGNDPGGNYTYGVEVGAFVQSSNNVAYVIMATGNTILGGTVDLEPSSAGIWRMHSRHSRGYTQAVITAPTTSVGLHAYPNSSIVAANLPVIELWGVSK